MHHQHTYVHLGYGWGLSLLGHGIVLGIAIVLLNNLEVVPKEERFRWEVSMVSPSKPTTIAETTPPLAPPVPQKRTSTPVAPMNPQPVMVAKPPGVEPVVAPPVPVAQPAQQAEPKEARQAVAEVHSVERIAERSAEPVKQTVATLEPKHVVPQVVAAQKAVTLENTVQEPVRAPVSASVHVPTVNAAPASVPIVSTPARSEPVVSSSLPVEVAPAPAVATLRSIETAPVAASVKEPQEPRVPPVPSPSVSTAPTPAPVQEAMAGPTPTAPQPPAKVDFGWVGQALYDRVSQLVRYPSSARLNELKGKVVVKVVIQEDGQLKDATVLKSSGHEELDLNALEVVRQATPIKMIRPLGRPTVTISIPVSYDLKG